MDVTITVLFLVGFTSALPTFADEHVGPGDISGLQAANLIVMYAPTPKAASVDITSEGINVVRKLRAKSIRLEYSKIYALMRGDDPGGEPPKRRFDTKPPPLVPGNIVEIVGTRGVLEFADLNKRDTINVLAGFVMEKEGLIDRIAVVIERATVTSVDGTESILPLRKSPLGHVLILADADELMPNGSDRQTVLTVTLDLADWLSVHEGQDKVYLPAEHALLGDHRRYESLSTLPENKDIRVVYGIEADTGWEDIERLDIAVNGIVVHLAETADACDFDGGAVHRMLQRRTGEPAYPGSQLYFAPLPPEQLAFNITEGAALPLRSLNRVPNGVILDIRLLVREVVATVGGRAYPVSLPRSVVRDGLKLLPRNNFIPVCNDHIVALGLSLDAGEFLGDDPRRGMLAAEAGVTTLAPTALRPGVPGHLLVPERVSIHIPAGAVERPLVIRLRETDVAQYKSSDPLFETLMRPVGWAYDFKPDAMMFRRPIRIGLALPEGYDAESTALYTYSPTPTGGVWMPDMPQWLPGHKRMIIEELNRVIAAKEASDNLEDHFPPDFNHIPNENYDNLTLERVNNRAADGFLITESNHFCIKTLFADLNVISHDWDYTPLLNGALDDLCQPDPVGWVRSSNQDVHCGGAAPDLDELEKRTKRTKRAIDKHGIAIYFRNSVRDYFAAVAACPGSGSTAYCYDMEDFEDDVSWAVETWREAINRNPDGSYIGRFRINCWQIEEDDDKCYGDQIDVKIKDLGNIPGQTVYNNVTMDQQLMDAARLSTTGRVRMRGTLLHELGHVLGLWHWAGPGTLMSYAGRARQNTTQRNNLCGTYTRAQLDPTNLPTGIVATLSADCQLPELENRWGTSTFFRPEPMNRLSCTDVRIIRDQVEPYCTADWCGGGISPLHCEILSESSEYAAPEMPVYDASVNEAYFDLDFDLRFPHCDAASEFSRVELELLAIDPSNRTLAVRNEYEDIYLPTLSREGDDYSALTHVESRKLVSTTSTSVGLLDVYPSFREYMASHGIDNLGMVLKAYADSDLTSGGVRSEFLAASTGLLRTPVLSPLDTQVTLEVSDVKRNGVSVGAPLLQFVDSIDQADLFPFIEDATLKPNVGRVLYVIVPGDDYSVEFSWQAPDLQFVSGDLGPARMWVDDIEITRGDWATMADWDDAGSVPLIETPDPAHVIPSPAHGDSCLYSSGTFELPLSGYSPIYDAMYRTSVGSNDVNLWKLYRVRFDYEYKHYGVAGDAACTPETDVCAHPGVCTPAGVSPFGPRSADFYVSILGPSGDIVHPPGVDSVCLLQAERSPEAGQNRFALQGDVRSIQSLAEYLSDEYHVRLYASGKVRVQDWKVCGTLSYGDAWLDAASVGHDGIITLDPVWENNCNDEAYDVHLQYRHRPSGGSDDDWTVVDLDSLRLRIDHREERCKDDFSYERTCSPWTGTYPCRW